MRSPLVVGLDLGTSQVKAAAFDAGGARLAAATRAYPTDYPQPGWAEQAPAAWQAACSSALGELADRLGRRVGDIAAIGLSAHAPGLVPVGADGRPLLEKAPIWQDERSAPQARALLAEIGAAWVGLGLPLAAFPAKLRWFTETHPVLVRKTALALGVKAYLAWWLTGQAATDHSSEPGNEAGWQWVGSACGWPRERLPPVAPASAVVGGLRPEVARETGLKAGLAVVMGLNDGASATLSQGARQPGEAVITLATNGVVFVVASQPPPAELRLRQALFCWPYVEGRWIVGGQTRAGAASLQWLLGLLCGGAPAAPDYEALLRECAGRPPGSRGVMFFPYLLGRGTPRDDPLARGGFSGLTLATERVDLVMAVLEGVAFALREALEALAGCGAPAGLLHITGGGARSPVWRQIVADVLNRALDYAEADSCLGAAMLAAVGAGLHPNLGAACDGMAGPSAATLPRPAAVRAYDGLCAEFRQRRDAWLARP